MKIFFDCLKSFDNRNVNNYFNVRLPKGSVLLLLENGSIFFIILQIPNHNIYYLIGKKSFKALETLLIFKKYFFFLKIR